MALADWKKKASSEGARKKKKKKKQDKRVLLIGTIVCSLIMAIQIVAGVVLCNQIAGLDIFPARFIYFAGIAVFAMAVVQTALIVQRKEFALMAGAVLGLCFSGILLLGNVYCQKTVDTLEYVTDDTVHTTMDKVSVAVMANSAYNSLEELSGRNLGVQVTLDRTNSDLTVDNIKMNLHGKIQVNEYTGIYDMVQDLYDGKTDAVVYNEAYRTLIEDEEDFEDFSDRIRVINTYTYASTDVVEAETEKAEPETEEALPIVLAEDPAKKDNVVTPEPFVLYMSGIDTFGDISTKSRSDVNILAVVNPKTEQILLVTTPRDYYVPLALSGNPMDKLTHAGIYGIDCSIQTLESLYHVSIDYYMRVNFSGFIKIVDALGGVNVMSDYDFTGEAGNYNFHKGYNKVNGKQALCFVRERHSFASGDVQRAKNQMYMINAIVKKAVSPVILMAYSDLLDSVSESFMTSMPKNKISEIAKFQLAKSVKWDIQTYSTSGPYAKMTTFSGGKRALSVCKMDEKSIAQAETLIQAVLNGEKVESTEE